MVTGFCFHWRAHRFNPWLGNLDPTNHVAEKKKKDWKQFFKKAFSTYDSFHKNFFGCTTGHVGSWCPPHAPNSVTKSPTEEAHSHNQWTAREVKSLYAIIFLSLLIVRFLVFLGMQISPYSRVKHKHTHKAVCDILFLYVHVMYMLPISKISETRTLRTEGLIILLFIITVAMAHIWGVSQLFLMSSFLRVWEP